MFRSFGKIKKATFRTIDSNNVLQILNKYDTILLDCDGVLWKTDHITPIQGIGDAIAALRRLKKQVLFVTNNAMHGRQAYLDKFRELCGFDADKDHVFGVAYAAAIYLRDIAPIQGRCYLLGGAGMAEELDEAGIPHTGQGPDPDPPTGDPKKLLQRKLESDIGAVLVGFDAHFSYNKLFKATSYLSTPGCMYVATNNVEMRAMLAPGRCQPITGALVAAVSAAARRQPTVIGKPNRHLLDCIRTKIPNLDLSRTLMVGDSLITDIGFARQCGIDSLLVLTGVSQISDVEECQKNKSPLIPTYVIPSLSDISKWCETQKV